MIRYNTDGSNPSMFRVNFDCSPQDISYGGVTHKGGGRTDRYGIWEGIKLVDTSYRINGGAWISKGGAAQFTVETNRNGDRIEVSARYELRTMGFHWDNRTYPFFYFGTNGGYRGGKYSWNTVSWPDDRWIYSNFAKIDSSWWKHDIWWSGWCERNANATSSQWRTNKEYRNGQSGSQGWRSDKNVGSNGTVQEYRKSVMMVFRKDYNSGVITSSGVATKPGTPYMEVPWMQGDEGTVKVIYKDPRNIPGKIWVRAECNGKNYDIATWDSSPTFWHDWVKTHHINFVQAFGEDSRGHDVVYVARAMNDYGYESDQVRQGTQRFNARPTTPTNAVLTMSSKNTITANWDRSTDLEGDKIRYCLYLHKKVNGEWVGIPGSGLDNGYWSDTTSYTFNVTDEAEGTEFYVNIYAHDGRIYSANYATTNTVMKGYTAIEPQIAYPRAEVHLTRPRILAKIKGNPAATHTLTYIKWKGKTYNNRDNSNLFNLAYSNDKTRYNHTIVFCPPENALADIGDNPVEIHIDNGFEDSPTLSGIITVLPINNIANRGDFIDHRHIKEIYDLIAIDSKAYEYKLPQLPLPNSTDIALARDLEMLSDQINKLNEHINQYGYVKTYTPPKLNDKRYITAEYTNSVATSIKQI